MSHTEALKQDALAQPAELHIGACITDGTLHATVMRYDHGTATVVATAEMSADALRGRDCITQMVPAKPARKPLTEAEIASAARPLYWNDRGAQMGLQDDILLSRAIERILSAKWGVKLSDQEGGAA